MILKRLLALALSFLAAPVFAQGDFVVRYKGLIAGRALLSDGFVTLYRSEHSFYLAIESSPSATESWTLRLPVDNGGSGECLKTNGSGVTSWATCYTLSGALLTANNLSELTATASTARTNLGLGTLATQSGTFSGTSSGTNTGDQTITLTGGVTGSGTGSFAATVVTNANLTGPITSVGNATTVADGELAALAGLTSAADRLPYFSGSGTAALVNFSSANRSALSALSGTNTGDQTTITGNAGTATALAANGANCSPGNYPLGVDASGAVEDCTAAGGGSVTTAALKDATYCESATGTDAYACTLATAPANLAAMEGVVVSFQADVVNTGAATIAFNGFAATPIVKIGLTTTTALVTGDIRAGDIVTVRYDGTSFACLSCDGNRASLTADNAFTGRNTFASGAAATPSVNFAFSTNTGFWQRASSVLSVSVAGAQQAEWSQFGLNLGSGETLGWASIATGGGNADTMFKRQSAGVIRSSTTGSNISALIGGGAAVASATAMPLPTGRVFHVTGTTTITSITSTNFASGAVITLIFDGVLTFTDGSNLKLAGDFVTTADDTITLVYDGTNWHEASRSVN